ncbi:MAG: competence/damage-inducible protein A [Calditrichaeota bacterium]|nr:MAG: competence/damage-inducible protein A [Calditrichota bacterium]
MSNIYAEIITIGNEVLAGYTVNTNATFISSRLREAGIAVKWVTTIADEPDAIKQAWQTAEERARLIITTGGLGPTPDDMTKNCIADFFNAPLEENARAAEDLKRFFALRKRPMTDINKGQILTPRGARVISNPVGTAPGLVMSRNDRVFAFFPGVPAEMKAMFTDGLMPMLTEFFDRPVIHTHLLRTTGIAESRLYEAVSDVVKQHSDFPLSFLPRQTGVDLRFTLIGDEPQTLKRWHAFIAVIRKSLHKYIFTEEERELHDVLLEMLRNRKMTLSVAESFTGGLIQDQITDIPGASDVFLGGVVAYSNDAKKALLAVSDHTLRETGAVSAATALEMARGVQERFQSDCSIATTGIAGPGGATPNKPVGLCYIAACLKDHESVREFRFGLNNRRLNKLRGAISGLEMLRRLLNGHDV